MMRSGALGSFGKISPLPAKSGLLRQSHQVSPGNGYLGEADSACKPLLPISARQSGELPLNGEGSKLAGRNIFSLINNKNEVGAPSKFLSVRSNNVGADLSQPGTPKTDLNAAGPSAQLMHRNQLIKDL